VDLKSARRWGLDFGNVLVKNIAHDRRPAILPLYKDAMDDKDNLGFLDRYLFENSSVIPGAIEGVRFLIDCHGVENVFVVSRAEGMERFCNTRLFIAHRFFAWTGLRAENVHFVDKRAEKAAVCKALNLEFFVDDRGEVLSHLRGIVPNRIWFNPTVNDQIDWCWSIGGRIVRNWEELMKLTT